MSYAVYTTSGFILGSSPSGEANKAYLIYTADFGLVRATAQGVRHLKSKLRYNLEDFSLAIFSLVRGKETWRITGAVADPAARNSDVAALRARVLSLVKRLVQGEERNDDLFSALKELFSIDDKNENDPVALETGVLVKVLAALGYIDLAAVDVLPMREKIQAVNRALRETHL